MRVFLGVVCFEVCLSNGDSPSEALTAIVYLLQHPDHQLAGLCLKLLSDARQPLRSSPPVLKLRVRARILLFRAGSITDVKTITCGILKVDKDACQN